jgi:hypothetical protein
MSIAFGMVRATLRCGGDDEQAMKIASTVIALYNEGETDPDRLCERTLTQLRQPPPAA